MPDDKKTDIILERFYNRYNKFNTKVLKKLGEVVKQFDGLSPSQAHILAQELKYGYDVYELLNELSQISGKSVQDIEKMLDIVAKQNVDFAETYYKAKNKEFVEYKDNVQLQRLVDAVKVETKELFTNISNSRNVGFVVKDVDGNKIYKPLARVYNDLIDEAVMNTTTGVSDFQSAMRNTMNQLADSGIKVHEDKVMYDSGYNRRIDSSVRQNVLTGIRKVNIGVQEHVGDEFGANGVEVSAHYPCAEDHLDINGAQFSKEEFERINSNLDRPVGEYNCTHFVFSIILGINQPQYSQRQLNYMRNQSLKKVEYEGKTYTKYEATQVQRKLETAIRQQKDRQIIARASNDKQGIAEAQTKISQLTQKYSDFSRSVGLMTQKDRLTVSGYRRVSTK